MSSQAPAWAIYLVPGFAASVFGYCLWTGKVGSRGRTVTRAKDPAGYWALMLMLAVLIGVFLRKAVSQ